MSFDLYTGNCLDVLATMPDNSIDAIVTDPPYGLAFMGKKWDYDVPSEEIWRECLRVLKPGGHLLAFAGTRTQHRMAVRIEDAGFEIRDMIAWVYGSGFPKSLDVSKAIDKRGGSVAGFEQFRDAVRAAMKRNGVSRSQLQAALGNHMLSHYLTAGSQPAVPNLRDYRVIRDAVQLGAKFDSLFADEAEREVVGQDIKARSTSGKSALPTIGGTTVYESWDITAPATPAAKQWQGWGTALKPALEPITVARKPFTGTVAANVLEHGTGAINVDGCRVGTEQRTTAWAGTVNYKTAIVRDGTTTAEGRWPANLIHDGSEEVVGLFPSPHSAGYKLPAQEKWAFNLDNTNTYGKGKIKAAGARIGDSGSAARFFYCAKASKRDRDEGCEGMEAKPASKMSGGEETRPDRPTNHPVRTNHHPTVKPTDLMRYLCRLVTPANGTVLDPFMGSGSTGKAAILEGFQFIGIDMTPEYVDIARARIGHAFKNKQNTLDL
jgi:DNA modification methylase